MDDQAVKLEYLKLLLDRGYQCSSAYQTTLLRFFSLAAIFFIILQFQPSEFNVFGAKVGIPQDWISAIAPLVLSLLYLQSVSLYDAQAEYARQVDRIALDALSGDTWKVGKEQIRAITESSFWFGTLGLLSNRQTGRLLNITTLVILLGELLTIFIVPILVIGYFLWLSWPSHILWISVVLTSVCVGIAAMALILFIDCARRELTSRE